MNFLKLSLINNPTQKYNNQNKSQFVKWHVCMLNEILRLILKEDIGKIEALNIN